MLFIPFMVAENLVHKEENWKNGVMIHGIQKAALRQSLDWEDKISWLAIWSQPLEKIYSDWIFHGDLGSGDVKFISDFILLSERRVGSFLFSSSLAFLAWLYPN